MSKANLQKGAAKCNNEEVWWQSMFFSDFMTSDTLLSLSQDDQLKLGQLMVEKFNLIHRRMMPQNKTDEMRRNCVLFYFLAKNTEFERMHQLKFN